MAVSFLTNCGGKPSPNQYSITIKTHDHLSFTTLGGKVLSNIKTTEWQDFAFKMKAINEGGSSDYLVPSFVNIIVNDTTLEPTSCPVSRISDIEANVTIKGNKIVGNIVISATAALKGFYTYRLFAHDGLKPIPSGGEKTEEDVELTLEPINDYEKLKHHNLIW